MASSVVVGRHHKTYIDRGRPSRDGDSASSSSASTTITAACTASAASSADAAAHGCCTRVDGDVSICVLNLAKMHCTPRSDLRVDGVS